MPAFRETRQRVHQYGHLVARWRKVARAAGLRLRTFAQAGDYACHYLATPSAAERALYISASIHGDEPAGAEGLLRWAEQRAGSLRDLPLLIFPCLNPWGLVNNQRTDAQGIDLNRSFDRNDLSPVAELKRLIAGRRFASSLCLHEDYDALGIYLYEISRRRELDLGRPLLQAAGAVLPIDSRKTIDGRRFDRGLMLRRTKLETIPLHPEAIYLYLHNTDQALTFETPSESSLPLRVAAMERVVELFVRRSLAQPGAHREQSVHGRL